MSDWVGWIVVWLLALVGSSCGAFLACLLYVAGRTDREEGQE